MKIARNPRPFRPLLLILAAVPGLGLAFTTITLMNASGYGTLESWLVSGGMILLWGLFLEVIVAPRLSVPQAARPSPESVSLLRISAVAMMEGSGVDRAFACDDLQRIARSIELYGIGSERLPGVSAEPERKMSSAGPTELRQYVIPTPAKKAT